MTTFRCPDCDFAAAKKGVCTKCKVAFKQCCPVCGSYTEKCTCTGDIEQTKGPGPH